MVRGLSGRRNVKRRGGRGRAQIDAACRWRWRNRTVAVIQLERYPVGARSVAESDRTGDALSADNASSSLPSLIPASVDLSLTTVPSYYDGQFRIDHRWNEKWKLSLSSVATDDRLEQMNRT